jgi:tripartite-type tricarboxylate transporter receptor subunit TctC
MSPLVYRAIFILFFVLLWSYELRAQTSFYQGKTVTIVVGSSAGTVYDLYARLIAQFLGKHIPRNPNIIVQNMPGAGSMIAANYVYGVAKPDGLTLASINPALYFNQLEGRKEVKYDWAKFTWIGSSDKSEHLLYMRADTPYKTLPDVRKAAQPPKCGATGTGTTGHYMPRLLEETVGTKFDIVTGYPGGSEIDLAVERGELQCRSLTIGAFYAREPYHTWRKKGFVRILMQTGRKRDQLLPDVPTLYELMDEYKTSELARRVSTVILASGDLGRPIAAAPSLPPDRVKTLRDSFMKTMSDRELLAEAKKKDLDITPTTGEELESLAKEVVSQPPDVIERMKKVLGQ